MPTHPNLLDFITRTMLGKEYRPFSSSLCYIYALPALKSKIFAFSRT
jgi:hypothetical protein